MKQRLNAEDRGVNDRINKIDATISTHKRTLKNPQTMQLGWNAGWLHTKHTANQPQDEMEKEINGMWNRFRVCAEYDQQSPSKKKSINLINEIFNDEVQVGYYLKL